MLPSWLAIAYQGRRPEFVIIAKFVSGLLQALPGVNQESLWLSLYERMYSYRLMPLKEALVQTIRIVVMITAVAVSGGELMPLLPC